MFKIRLFLLSLFFGFGSLCSRATVLDSLLNTLSEIPAVVTSENLDQKSILCNNIAVRYQELGEQNKARFYFLQSIAFTEERIELEEDWSAQNCYDLAYLYRNIATFESTTGNKEQATRYIDKSEEFYKRLKNQLPSEEYNAIMVEFYHSNFAMSFHVKDYVKGETQLSKVEKMLLKTGESSIYLAENYRYRAELLCAIKNFDEGELYAEKALQVYDQNAIYYPIDEFVFVRSYVFAKFRNKKYEELIAFLDQRKGFRTIEEAIESAASEDVVDLGNFVDNIFIRSFALMRMYDISDDIDLINEADRWQQAAFQIAEDYIVKNNVDKIGNIVSDPENKVVGNLICMAHLKNHQELTSDKIIEGLRMIDVQQSARLHVERVSYSVNRQLSQEEKKMKNELIYVNLKLEEASKQKESRVNIDSLSDIAYSLSSKIQELNKQTKNDKIMAEYQIGQNQFKELLNNFIERSNKNVVTYFYENKNDSVYVIGANQSEVYFEVLAVPENFIPLIAESYQLNARLQTNPETIALQKELNKALYNYLVKPIRHHFNTTELLIYPNNEMSYVSFDAMLDEEEKYLFESYALQYTSSLFSVINEKRIPSGKPTFASYYPRNYGTDSLAYLNNGEHEVGQIKDVLGGETFKGNAATKQSFLDVSNQKQILHLASHSVLNVARPYESYILFDQTTDSTENKLFAHEIFSKTLNCEMVTLSSCNSAKGEIEEGIGVVSLANAFYFAGVPATVSSLWSAQDKSSSEIMIDFYTNLKSGLNKSQSLQRAKINYFKRADKIKKQPFFWANYVVYGDDSPLYEKSNSTSWTKYLVGAGSIILLLVIVWFYPKKK